MEPITRKDYTDSAWSLRAINRKYQKLVVGWGKASRLVDYWVDEGVVADDGIGSNSYLKLALRNEEKFFNDMLAIELDLPKREIVNARRQLQRILEEQFAS